MHYSSYSVAEIWYTVFLIEASMNKLSSEYRVTSVVGFVISFGGLVSQDLFVPVVYCFALSKIFRCTTNKLRYFLLYYFANLSVHVYMLCSVLCN